MRTKIYFTTDMRVTNLLLFHRDDIVKQRYQRNNTIEKKSINP